MPLVQLLLSTGHWILWGWLPLLLRGDLGLDLAAVGDLTGLYQLASATALLPIGWLSDRHAPRVLCFVGAILVTGGALGLAAVGLGGEVHTKGLAAAMMLLGVGWSICSVSLSALFYKRLLDSTTQGFEIGRFVSAGVMGYALGPALGAMLTRYGLAGPAIGAAVAFVAMGLCCLLLPTTECVPIHPGEYLRDLRRAGPLFLMTVIVITSTHTAVEFVGLPLVARDAARLSDARQGVFYAIIGTWVAVLSERIGRRFDRSPRPVLLLSAGVALSGVFQAVTGLARGFASLVSIRLLHTIGDSMFLVVTGILTARVFPQKRIGGLFALTQLVRTATTAVGAAAAGRLDRAYGHTTVFALSGAVMMAGALGFLLFRPALRRAVGLPERDDEPPPPVPRAPGLPEPAATGPVVAGTPT